MQKAVRRVIVFVRTHPRLRSCALFLLVALLVAFVFYLRFPDNYLQPNFYAEDGIYAHNIVDKGLPAALMTPFNGYYIWGIYMVQGIGFLLDHMLFGGQLVALPQSIALASYAFLGLCAALPVLLLKRLLPWPVIAWLVAMAVFVPLPVFDNGVIGTTANLKFMFLYVAVLLLIYRHYCDASQKRIMLIDLGILICGYTDIAIYTLLPFALLRYGKRLLHLKTLRELLKNRSFISLLVMAALLLVQLVVIKVRGIPDLPGFYTEPYRWNRSVEVFGARSYLFSYLYGFYTHLTSVRTTGLMVLFFGLAAWVTPKRLRFMVIIAAAAVLLANIALLSGRPGISWLFPDYANSGPDHYFYAQNIVACLIGAGIIAGLMLRFKQLWAKIALAVVPFLVLLQLPYAGSFGLNDFMADTRGAIYAQAQAACKAGDTAITIKDYPQDPFAFTTTANKLCTDAVGRYRAPHSKLYLRSDADRFVAGPGTTTSFTQTFVAPHGLKGIDLLLITYGQQIKDHYDLTLYDSDCRMPVRRIHLHSMQISDNRYYPIALPGLKTGETYCFGLAAATTPVMPIALRLAAPDSYRDGRTVVNGASVNTPVMFEFAY